MTWSGQEAASAKTCPRQEHSEDRKKEAFLGTGYSFQGSTALYVAGV